VQVHLEVCRERQRLLMDAQRHRLVERRRYHATVRHARRALDVDGRGERAGDAAVVAQLELETKARPGPAREAAVVMAERQLESRSIRRRT
jgi:hypothetical protein